MGTRYTMTVRQGCRETSGGVEIDGILVRTHSTEINTVDNIHYFSNLVLFSMFIDEYLCDSLHAIAAYSIFKYS